MDHTLHKGTKTGRFAAGIAQTVRALTTAKEGDYTEVSKDFFDRLAKRSAYGVEVVAEGVRCLWNIPPEAPEDTAVLYFHGGAYTSGRGVINYTGSWLAHGIGLRVLTVDYRLSGDAPYPAALEDARKTYSWLLEQGFERRNIVIVGDSAGGGLALALAMKLRDEGCSMPRCLVTVSPWCDLGCNGRSFEEKKDNILRRDGLLERAEVYAGGMPLDYPYISPLFGRAEGLPPVFIAAGTGEALMSDSVNMAQRLSMGGCICRLHLWEGMHHDFALTMPFLRDSTQVFRLMREFIDEMGNE